jgi:hypothetical protein
VVSVPARDQARILREIARAKARFGLPENAVVYSCYEAGRDGFWLDRFLRQFGEPDTHQSDVRVGVDDSNGGTRGLA